MLTLYFAGNPGEQIELQLLQAIFNEELFLEMISESTLPKIYDLSLNYSNPSNPKTEIKYQIPIETYVSIQYYIISICYFSLLTALEYYVSLELLFLDIHRVLKVPFYFLYHILLNKQVL